MNLISIDWEDIPLEGGEELGAKSSGKAAKQAACPACGSTKDRDDSLACPDCGEGEERDKQMVCPACGEAWVALQGGSAEIFYNTHCPHLKCIVEQAADEIQYLNGFTKDKLEAAAEQAYIKLNPESEKMTGEDILQDSSLDDALWKNMELLDVDTLLDFTESGIACGPVSYTIFFGAKLKP